VANEHQGHRSRVRDRVRKESLDNFQEYQVLEYALMFPIPYKDTNVLAHKLINKFGTLAGVLEANEEDLMKVEGMGEVTANFLANIINIYNYYEKSKSGKKEYISSPGQTYRYLKPFFVGKRVEELYLLCLTPKNKVHSVEKIAEGTACQSVVNIRTILDKMSRSDISNIIIAHNHPKGRPEPSIEDNRLTKAIVTNLSISGSHLIDHIIFGEPEEVVEKQIVEIVENGITKEVEQEVTVVKDSYSYRKSGVIDQYIREASEFVSVEKAVSQPCARYEVDDD